MKHFIFLMHMCSTVIAIIKIRAVMSATLVAMLASSNKRVN